MSSIHACSHPCPRRVVAASAVSSRPSHCWTRWACPGRLERADRASARARPAGFDRQLVLDAALACRLAERQRARRDRRAPLTLAAPPRTQPLFLEHRQRRSAGGVTLHTLAPEYDTGAILLQRAIPLGDRNSWQLARALDRPSLALLREGVGRFARSHPPAPTAQDEQAATWAPEPTGRELGIDWTWPTERVLRRIRAISPVPPPRLGPSRLRRCAFS